MHTDRMQETLGAGLDAVRAVAVTTVSANGKSYLGWEYRISLYITNEYV
jgi:hypothetical protein